MRSWAAASSAWPGKPPNFKRRHRWGAKKGLGLGQAVGRRLWRAIFPIRT